MRPRNLQHQAGHDRDSRSVTSREPSILDSTHATLLIAAGGLLGMALVLEGQIASRVADSIHEHGHLPATVHGFAYLSVVLSLWPAGRQILVAARRRRLDWRVSVICAVITLLALGQTMIGAGSAFLFSLGSLLFLRFSKANPRQGSAPPAG